MSDASVTTKSSLKSSKVLKAGMTVQCSMESIAMQNVDNQAVSLPSPQKGRINIERFCWTWKRIKYLSQTITTNSWPSEKKHHVVLRRPCCKAKSPKLLWWDRTHSSISHTVQQAEIERPRTHSVKQVLSWIFCQVRACTSCLPWIYANVKIASYIRVMHSLQIDPSERSVKYNCEFQVSDAAVTSTHS